jgi:hypothetical protein
VFDMADTDHHLGEMRRRQHSDGSFPRAEDVSKKDGKPFTNSDRRKTDAISSK